MSSGKLKKGEARNLLESKGPVDRVLNEEETNLFFVQIELSELKTLRETTVPELVAKIEEFKEYAAEMDRVFKEMQDYIDYLEWELERK